MNTEKTERGWRGTPDLWLDAAYQLLVEAMRPISFWSKEGSKR
jgi:hypothetical protein